MKTTTLFAGACIAALITGGIADAAAKPAAKPAPAAAPAATTPAAATTTTTTTAAPAVPAAPAAAPAAAAPAVAATTTTTTTTTAPAPMTAKLVAKGDLIDTLAASGQFNTFIKALTAANLVGVVKSHPSMTVFAPTDAAFAALPAGQLDALMKNPAALQKLLAYHLVNTTVDSTKIKGAKGPVKTVANTDLELDGSGANLMVNSSTITQADVKTTGGGTIQVIDKVLTPEGAAAPAPTPVPAAPAATTEPAAPAAPDAGTPVTASPKPADSMPAEPAEKPDPTPKG